MSERTGYREKKKAKLLNNKLKQKQSLSSKIQKKLIFVFLSFFSFMIVGMGKASDYCMKKRISDVAETADAIRIRYLKCKRIQCPHCWMQWMRERALELSIKIEAYAEVYGDRPSIVFVSISEKEITKWTWKNYLAFFRKGYDRLESLGAVGGVRIFHPFRIHKNVQERLRVVGYGKKGKMGGFWKAARENVLGLTSWYSYVRLSPHIHCIVFPSFLKEHTKNDIIVRKYGVLKTTKDVVSHVQYLLSHSGLLVGSENEPATFFGALFKFDPKKHLSEERLKKIENRVKSAMGMNIIEKTEIEEAVDEKYKWIPIHEFARFSAEKLAWVDAFITSIENKEHRLFVANLVDVYNSKLDDSALRASEKHVFLEDVGHPPEGFIFIYDFDVLRAGGDDG
jgi:hypothetical protein